MRKKEGNPNGTGDLKRYKNLFCKKGKNKGKQHEPGEWELLNRNGMYKVRVRYCRYCKQKLNEKVLF